MNKNLLRVDAEDERDKVSRQENKSAKSVDSPPKVAKKKKIGKTSATPPAGKPASKKTASKKKATK